jgi:CheY-like chemotaxis protein
VLIVDDDIRNIFALSSVLEEYGMKIVSAENGRDAIDILQNAHDIDIVLMDIMMPEMDGLDTMKEIRKIESAAPADRRGHGEGDGRRPRALHRGRRLGLPVEAGRPRAAAGVLRAWLQR